MRTGTLSVRAWCDNRTMPIVAPRRLNHTELDRTILKAVRKLGKDVVRVNFNLGTDSTDEPCIFFRIVLTDAASREKGLLEVTDRITKILEDEIRPQEEWGLLSYCSFRSASEQKQLREPAWA